MVPNLVVLFHFWPDLVEPSQLFRKVFAELVQKLSAKVPGRIVPLIKDNCLLSELKCAFRDLLLAEEGAEVAHDFLVYKHIQPKLLDLHCSEYAIGSIGAAPPSYCSMGVTSFQSTSLLSAKEMN